MNDNEKYYWYISKTNTYLSKEESKPIIERKIKLNEILIKKISNAYINYNSELNKASEYKDRDDINYLFSIGETISFICTEFEEIIKEFDEYNDK